MVLDLTPPRLQKLCHLLPPAQEWGWGKGWRNYVMIRGSFASLHPFLSMGVIRFVFSFLYLQETFST